MENVNIEAYRTINSEKLASYPVIKSNKDMIIRRTSKTAIVVASNKRAFKAWWKGITADWLTMSAAKYCHNPVHFTKEDVYVIKTIDLDASDIMDNICTYA